MAGKTFCGKTRFVQKLTVNNFLGEVKKAEWVSQIELSKSRDAEIHSCFSTQAQFNFSSKKLSLEINDPTFTFINDNIFREKKWKPSLLWTRSLALLMGLTILQVF